MRTIRRLVWLGAVSMISTVGGAHAMSLKQGPVEATINGLRITVDRRSGGVLKLSFPGVGAILESDATRASAIDLAYPVPEFDPLRLASRYSDGAKITQTPDSLTIRWDRLGPSRSNYALTGAVSATVTFRAHPDGRSVILTAEVANDSDVPVRQVLFPDLKGLLPFCGRGDTCFRSCGSVSRPFLDLTMNESRESTQFMDDFASLAEEHRSGGLHGGDMVVRWMDFGGLKGGLSVFPRAWGWDPEVTVRLQKSAVEEKVRLSYVHYETLAKGQTWKSPEYVLTPHRSGWAKGIEPFRDWVQEHVKRIAPLPKHVAEGLGFRSVWMSQNRPTDPKDKIFGFADLPQLAKESKEHGLDELVFWAWNDFFALPCPPPYAHLGTEADMANAVRECRRIGVNLSPFVSWVLQNAAHAPRYGAQVEGRGGWTYHTELIPRFNPPYAYSSATVQVGPFNEIWQSDVLAGSRHLADLGIPSLCWDQVWTVPGPEPNQKSLIRQIRSYASKVDPQATFSGEELYNWEVDADVLDYTWDWRGYGDTRPLVSVYRAPRVNCHVSSSPLVAKLAFADNLYLNVMPRKPESVNGTDWIRNRPALSRALKQCAALRRKFLSYFVEGTLIGDCILTSACPQAHVTAYALKDRILIVIVNRGKKRSLSLKLDAAPWVAGRAAGFEIREFDAGGKQVSAAAKSARCSVTTRSLEPEAIAVVEIAAIAP